MSDPDLGRARPVAVTAAAVLTPLADRIDDFTEALLAGRSAVTLPHDGPSTGVPHTGVSSPPPGAPSTDGEPPLPVAALTDFTVAGWAERHLADAPETAAELRRVAGRAALPARTAACVALQAVRDAGLPEGWGERAALLVAGSNLALAHQAETVLGYRDRPGRLRASYAVTHLDVDVVGTVSQLTGVRGEGWTVGAASASGTVALIQAARMVAAGSYDRALVVAPAAELSTVEVEAFRRSGAMACPSPEAQSPAGQLCRPFDRDRRGFVRGEGAAAVVLERTDLAYRRCAPVLAEIAGYGQRLDARRGTEPDTEGQVAAMRAALASAGLAPSGIDYVNAHGTGSVLGDEVESASLLKVFGPAAPLRVNSTKPLVGHCLSAAGLVEAVAVIAQLRAGVCHPNPNLAHPIDPLLPLVGAHAETWPMRTALTNSFAFGGINASVVLRAPTLT